MSGQPAGQALASIATMTGARRTFPFAVVCLALSLCAQDSLFAEVHQQTDKSSEDKLNGVISRIEFSGLRRIPAATLRSKLNSKPGEAPAAAKIEQDVRTLEGTGWFDSVSVELEQIPVLLAYSNDAQPQQEAGETLPPGTGAVVLRLLFVVAEKPFLAKVGYRGGHLLTHDQIEQIFSARGIALKTRMPCNRSELWHAARALEAALAEMGHPKARVQIELEGIPTAAVRATFLIDEGPRVEVAEVSFSGNESFSERRLRKQMKDVAPGAALGGLRGKTNYTRERIAADLERLLQFYRNHGYAEARTGEPEVQYVEASVRKWFPWPRTTTKEVMLVRIPIQEGTAYRLERAEIEGASAAIKEKAQSLLEPLRPQSPYSEEKVLRAEEALLRLEAEERVRHGAPRPQVELISKLDRSAANVRVLFRVHEAPQYTVRRIEFAGHHRFSDRYYRRRIELREGETFDPEKLERGLQRLAREGFVRPVDSKDIQIKLDDNSNAADILIRVEEIGQQRISFVGGGVGSAGTLGIAYSLFNLLGGEEWLTVHLEGGPESLHMLLGLAKEGFFGTRASLGLNLFQDVVQPRLLGRERLFRARTSGLNATYHHSLSQQETAAVNYELSRSRTTYPLHSPVLLPTGDMSELTTNSTRSTVRLAWTHDSGQRLVEATAGASGGWLGGSENVLRSSMTMSRLDPDVLTHGRNAWAFRSYWAGTSSFGGRRLPLQARLFDGEELVRGFRRGELGPYVLSKLDRADGMTEARADSAGANLMAAANAEYRVPLEGHIELAAFLDAGTGWLLPRWMGGSPEILSGTNGAVRSSAGVEVRLRLPVLNQTVRFYYAANPMRLAQAFLLPSGAAFRASERRAAFGWGLGNLF